MPFKRADSQRGIAQIVLLLFLLAGIGVGTVVVQNRTNLIPHAQCDPEGDRDCGEESTDEQAAQQKQEQDDLERGAQQAGKTVEEYKVDDCKSNPGKSGCSDILERDRQRSSGQTGSSGGGSGGEEHDSTNASDACRDDRRNPGESREDCEKRKAGAATTQEEKDAACGDNKTYCDGGVKIYKTGGYWDGSKCVYDFVDTKESCAGQKDGSLSNQDNARNASLYDNSIQCAEITRCQGGRAVRGTPEGLTNGQCRYQYSEVASVDCSGKTDGSIVSTNAGKRYSVDPSKSLTPDDVLVRTDRFKTEGKQELDNSRLKIRDDYGIEANKSAEKNLEDCQAKGHSDEKCKQMMNNLENIVRAQNEFDKFATIDCSKETDQAKCQVIKQAAFDNAKLRYRTAMCDAVESNIKGANCVTDAGDSQNLIKVKICADGTTTCEGAEKRVLVGCSSKESNEKGECEKILNYRSGDGSIKELPDDAKKQLHEQHCGASASEADKQTSFCKDPLQPFYSLSDLPSGLKGGLNGACTATQLGCIGAGAAGTSAGSPGSSIPAGQLGSDHPSEACRHPEIIQNFKDRPRLTSSCSKCLVDNYRESVITNVKNDLSGTGDVSGCSDNDLANFYAGERTHGSKSSSQSTNEFNVRTQGHTDQGQRKEECSASCGPKTFNSSSTTTPTSASSNERVRTAVSNGVTLTPQQQASLEKGDRIEYTPQQRQQIIDKTTKGNPALKGTDLAIAVGKALNSAGSLVEQATGATAEIAGKNGGDPAEAAVEVAKAGYTTNSDRQQKIAGTAFEAAFANTPSTTSRQSRCSTASKNAIDAAKKRGITITQTDFQNSISFVNNCK